MESELLNDIHLNLCKLIDNDRIVDLIMTTIKSEVEVEHRELERLSTYE